MSSENLDDEDRIDAFVEEVARALGFLCDAHHFDAPTTEIDRRLAAVTVTFAKGSIAIEATHELREQDVELTVARLENGRKPPKNHVDRGGKRRRARLIEILMKRGVHSFGANEPAEPETPQQRLSRQLARYARLLEEHTADLLSGSAEALDSLAPQKASLSDVGWDRGRT